MPLEPMMELAAQLATRLSRVALSNTNAIHMQYIHEHFPLFQEFDAEILSHEVGLLKPDESIYRLALKKAGLIAEQAVFIDDLSANVDGARRVGLHAIHHQNVETTRAELTKLGVTPI